MGSLMQSFRSEAAAEAGGAVGAPAPIPREGFGLGLGATLYACFLCAGSFKGSELFRDLPIDLTLLLAVLSGLAGLVALWRQRLRLPAFTLWVLGLTLACLPALLITSWTVYATEKVTRMFTLTLGSMMIALVLFHERNELRRLFNALLIIGLVLDVIGVYDMLTGTSPDRVTATGSDAIQYARVSGVSLLWLILIVVEHRGLKRLILAGLMGLPAASMMFSGSRGPIVCLLTTVIVAASFYLRDRRFRWVLPVISLAVALQLVYAATFAPESALERVLDFFGGRTEMQGTDRPVLFLTALKAFVRKPMGIGWGGFDVLYQGVSAGMKRGNYPHNLVLEALVEGGLVCGVVVVLLLVVVLIRTGRLARNSHFAEVRMLFLLILFTTLGAMFSSDWNDNRDVFSYLVIGGVFAELHLRSSARPDHGRRRMGATRVGRLRGTGLN
jgi:O-antigen ligase